mmetsp:Transcript_36263/g.60548  ORF Transcript_36263/g.60548 Transcript_36263/m.60548 type:complete len:85 (+) Transcript_36263:1460-1714(+)
MPPSVSRETSWFSLEVVPVEKRSGRGEGGSLETLVTAPAPPPAPGVPSMLDAPADAPSNPEIPPAVYDPAGRLAPPSTLEEPAA